MNRDPSAFLIIDTTVISERIPDWECLHSLSVRRKFRNKLSEELRYKQETI